MSFWDFPRKIESFNLASRPFHSNVSSVSHQQLHATIPCAASTELETGKKPTKNIKTITNATFETLSGKQNFSVSILVNTYDNHENLVSCVCMKVSRFAEKHICHCPGVWTKTPTHSECGASNLMFARETDTPHTQLAENLAILQIVANSALL